MHVAHADDNLRKPPVFPTVFDRAAIQTMTDHVEDPHIYDILRVGYFIRQRQQDLPIADGYKIIETAADNAKPASLRWFLLKSIQGYAAFRMPSIDTAAAYGNYNMLFEQAHSTSDGYAQYVVEQTIIDYVYLIPGRLQVLNMQATPAAQKCLLTAWNANVVHLTSGAKVYHEPEWAPAIKAAGLMAKFQGLLSKYFSVPSNPRTLQLIETKAEIIGDTNPAEAEALLRQVSVPDVIQPEALKKYYDQLIAREIANRDYSRAILDTLIQIQRTRHGKDRLFRLYVQTNDFQSAINLLTSAKNTGNDSELLDIADAALPSPSAQPSLNKHITKALEDLLKSVINDRSGRPSYQQIRATDLYSRLLVCEGRRAEAVAVINNLPDTIPITSYLEQQTLDRLRATRESLKK